MTKDRLLEMWNSGARVSEIAFEAGVSTKVVYQWRDLHMLPMRSRSPNSPTPDPSPEEIERLKAILKERGLAAMRNEHPDVTRARVRREFGQ